MRFGIRALLAGVLCGVLPLLLRRRRAGADSTQPPTFRSVRPTFPSSPGSRPGSRRRKAFSPRIISMSTLSAAQNLSVLPGTVGRQFDFAPSTAPDLLKAAGSGLDVVAVAASVFETEDNPSTLLMVSKESGIASAKDLVGKLVATPTIGGVIHVSVLYWLKKNGVDPSSVRAVEVPFPAMADQLKAKRVDAVETVEPFAGSAAQRRQHVVLTAPSAKRWARKSCFRSGSHRAPGRARTSRRTRRMEGLARRRDCLHQGQSRGGPQDRRTIYEAAGAGRQSDAISDLSYGDYPRRTSTVWKRRSCARSDSLQTPVEPGKLIVTALERHASMNAPIFECRSASVTLALRDGPRPVIADISLEASSRGVPDDRWAVRHGQDHAAADAWRPYAADRG